jgi:prophage regulatory protein
MQTEHLKKPQAKRRGTQPQPLHAAQLDDALLTLRTASAVAGLSLASLYRRAASDATFPPLIRLSARATRIHSADLKRWIASQAAKAA